MPDQNLHAQAVPTDRQKGRPPIPFETIAVAIAFSPRLEAIMSEAVRLAARFEAQLLLIHIGKRTAGKEVALQQIRGRLGIESGPEVIWGTGDPVSKLLAICKQHMVDLLIAGALRRENVFRYFLGSVARGLSRRAKCSLLLLTEPELRGAGFETILVDCVDHPKTIHVLNTAWHFARKVGARELRAVKEVDRTGVSLILSSDSTGERAMGRERQLVEAEDQLRLLTSVFSAGEPKVMTAVLPGQHGFTIRKYAEECRADLLVLHSPDGRYGLMDRIFTHDMNRQNPHGHETAQERGGDGDYRLGGLQ